MLKQYFTRILAQRKKKSQSALEFLVVFSILLLFFLIVADVGLFFKEIYTVQAVSDEALSRLTSYQYCVNTGDVIPILKESAGNYYPGWAGRLEFEYSGIPKFGSYFSKDGSKRFIFTLSCRNDSYPSSLIFTHKYVGLFMYMHGKSVTSNISTNTTFY